MLNNSRYITAGIQRNISPEVQFVLWNLIDKRKHEYPKMDYLQVMELKIDFIGKIPYQSILHRQEQPPYSRTHRVAIENPINSKIWILDDGNVTTMLFPNEY